MIRRRQAKEWHSERAGEQNRPPICGNEDAIDPFFEDLYPLTVCHENFLQPGAQRERRSGFDGEIVVYVQRGTIRWDDSTDTSSIIQAGEFAKRTVGVDRVCTHRNESLTHGARFFEVGVRSTWPALVESSVDHQRFTAAQRRATLCLVASASGQSGSLHLAEDVHIYSTLLLPGQIVVHELPPGHRVWLHVVEGELTVNGITAIMGDGVGVTNERALSIKADAHAEFLFVDLGRNESGR